MFILNLYQLGTDGSKLELWRTFKCASLAKANTLIASYGAIEGDTVDPEFYEYNELYWELTAM